MLHPAAQRVATTRLRNPERLTVGEIAAEDAEFCRYFVDRNLQTTRAALGFGIALVSMLCILDAVLMPIQFVEQVVPLRILMMLLPMIAAFASSYFVADRIVIPAVLGSLAMIVGVATILISSLALRAGYSFVHWEILAITCLAYLALGLTGRQSTMAGWTIFFVFVGLTYLGGTPTEFVAYGILLLGSVNLAGTHFSIRREIDARKLFESGKELKRRARVDGLTSLYNRRTFDQHLRQVWKQARRDEKSVAVVLVDIDHFKLYNDCYGHKIGDECIQAIAEIAGASVNRPMDLVARYGGEEFALVLYDPSPAFLASLSQALCKNVVDRNIEHRASAISPSVTISVGASITAAAGTETPEKLIRRADDALYEAKTLGRNRAVVFKTEWGQQTGSQRTHILV